MIMKVLVIFVLYWSVISIWALGQTETTRMPTGVRALHSLAGNPLCSSVVSQGWITRYCERLPEDTVPYGFLEYDSAWNLRSVAERVIRIHYALAKYGSSLERPAYNACIQSLLDHTRYLFAFNNTKSEYVCGLSGAGLLLSSLYLQDGMPEKALWELCGQLRLVSYLDSVPVEILKPCLGAAALSIVFVPELAKACLSLNPGCTGSNRTRLVLSDSAFFTALNLEYAGLKLVKEAVLKKDYAKAKKSYLEYRAGHANRQAVLLNISDSADVDLNEADDACRNVLILRNHMYRKHDYGSTLDWTSILDNDIETNTSLVGHLHPQLLARAYSKTHSAKYAHNCARMLRSWMDQVPPMHNITESINTQARNWQTLNTGGRLYNTWPEIMARMQGEREFHDTVLFDMIKRTLESARYLCAHATHRGNWCQVESSGLGIVACLFPEFHESGIFQETAMRRFNWILTQYFLKDGFHAEVSFEYHAFPLGAVAKFYEIAKGSGAALPAWFSRAIAQYYDVLMYGCFPDYTLPKINDGGAGEPDASLYLQNACRLFDRKDHVYVSTKGREGVPPSATTYHFPEAGIGIMRENWTLSSQYLLFEMGFYGTGHQHEDKLNMVLYAYGRPLLYDPGIYDYNLDDFESYFRSSLAHSVIMVDGKGQNRSFLVDEEHQWVKEPIPDPDSRWIPAEKHCFAESWYTNGFFERSLHLWENRDKTVDLETGIDVQHQRTILWSKSGYYILRDILYGEGEHEAEQIFHLAPVIEKHTADGIRPGNLREINKIAVVTDEPGLANLAIIPVETNGLSKKVFCGSTDPVRGWTALYAKQPSNDLVYYKTSTLPMRFTTVLVPLEKGENQLPAIEKLSTPADWVGFRIFYKNRTDMYLAHDKGPGKITIEDITFEGEQVLLSTFENSTQGSFFVVGGRLLEQSRKVIFQSAVCQSMEKQW